MLGLRRSAVKHPIISSTIITLIFILSMQIGGLIVYYGPPFFRENGDFLFQFTAESSTALIAVAIAAILGYSRIWNQTENFFKGLVAGGYLIFICIVNLWSAVVNTADSPSLTSESAWKFAVFVAAMFIIGFTEETFYRGIIANLFFDRHASDPAGAWTAVIWSGTVFGLMHVTNILAIASIDGIVGVLVQVISAIATGMFLTAIYLRCRNIWVMIFLHSFLDFCAMLPQALGGGGITEEISSYSPNMIISAVPFMIATFVIMRPSKLNALYAGPALSQVKSGDLVTRIEVTSHELSKKALKRAVIAVISIALILYALCVAAYADLNGGVFLQDSYSQSFSFGGVWDGEEFFNETSELIVDESGEYNLTVISYPSSSNAYLTVRIVDSNGAVYFEKSYGGRCSDVRLLNLEAGDYLLELDYDYSRLTYSAEEDISYTTSIKIQPR